MNSRRWALVAALVLGSIALASVIALLTLFFTTNTLGFGAVANLSDKTDARTLAECQTLLLTVFGFWLVWTVRKYLNLSDVQDDDDFTMTGYDLMFQYVIMAIILLGLGLVIWIVVRAGVTFGSGDLGTSGLGLGDVQIESISKTIKGKANAVNPLTILTKAVYAATGALTAYRMQNSSRIYNVTAQ